MKKSLLLILAMGIFCSLNAQYKLVSIRDHLENKKVKVQELTPSPSGSGSTYTIVGQKFDEAIIGQSTYDVQTYGSLQKRMYAYPDGTIGAIWMMAFEEPDWPDRGTGYNFYDGNNWGVYPTGRLETVRTGYPCYTPFGANGEITVSHYLEDPYWGLAFNKREEKGTGTWEEFYLSGPTDIGIVWPALITNGTDNTNIHILALSYGSIYMGQDGALLYYRSLDGGNNWDIQHHFFNELGPDYFVNVGADEYSWAQPRGETLAFSVGFSHQTGYIMKSYDNGDTWEQILAYENPYTPYTGGATPTFGGGDGSQAIALDSDGNAHIAFGRMRHVYDEEGTLYYYPATEGMIYWNETMAPLDTTIISSYTLDFLIANGNLIGWAIPSQGDSTIINFGTYSASLTSFPQINIDNNDKILALWSGVAPGYTNGAMNYRHICGRASIDGGATWEPIKDFNTDLQYIFSECVYPAMSPAFTENNFHFVFQADDEPGIFVWIGGHAATNNSFIYMKHPISFLTGTDEQISELNTDFNISQNFPNPFHNKTFVLATLEKNTSLSLKIFNIIGQEVRYVDLGLVNKGEFRFDIRKDNLPVGVYYYTVSDGLQSITRKMIIQ
ncbi:MAG: T9SS type A sorting domain-containing protein [Bacteroidales bacterium]|nr:T9SS type A sorting domain-containing protein [Bacteroidales bacterium]